MLLLPRMIYEKNSPMELNLSPSMDLWNEHNFTSFQHTQTRERASKRTSARAPAFTFRFVVVFCRPILTVTFKEPKEQRKTEQRTFIDNSNERAISVLVSFSCSSIERTYVWKRVGWLAVVVFGLEVVEMLAQINLCFKLLLLSLFVFFLFYLCVEFFYS